MEKSDRRIQQKVDSATSSVNLSPPVSYAAPVVSMDAVPMAKTLCGDAPAVIESCPFVLLHLGCCVCHGEGKTRRAVSCLDVGGRVGFATIAVTSCTKLLKRDGGR